MRIQAYANVKRSTDMSVPDPQISVPVIDTRSLRGELRRHEPMKRHVSWRAGGHAASFYQPADIEDLAVFLRIWPESEPIFMIGLGSNLLVRDGGVKGAIVSLHARLNDLLLIERNKEGGLVYAGAGIPCAKLARFTALHDLAGAEFMAGIPGTIGGALAMNAGCYGSETWELVERIRTIDRTGTLCERIPEDYHIGYRRAELRTTSLLPSSESWFVGGWFRLRSGRMETSRQAIKTLLTARIKSQPLGIPNAGSVFRNPEGKYAARLIDQCGLKGLRIGDAMLSTLHANFILNCGQATASEIEAVINTVQNTVEVRTGIQLVTEVRIIGQDKGYEQ